ncbi:MAG: hypothetical protein ACXIU7_04750 [Roseinatronobacter sp.]
MTPQIALTTAILAVLTAASARAEGVTCETRIDGMPVTIHYHRDDPSYTSLRERFLRRGQDCPGSVVITYLTPDLTAAEREVFCANFDPETRSHSQPALGRRDAFGRCTEPSRTCAVVNATRDETAALMGLDRPGGGRALLSATLSTVTHSSGALILSGNAATLTGMFSSAGAAAGTVAASPALLAGAAASLVVIGGAVYMCADDRVIAAAATQGVAIEPQVIPPETNQDRDATLGDGG